MVGVRFGPADLVGAADRIAVVRHGLQPDPAHADLGAGRGSAGTLWRDVQLRPGGSRPAEAARARPVGAGRIARPGTAEHRAAGGGAEEWGAPFSRRGQPPPGGLGFVLLPAHTTGRGP